MADSPFTGYARSRDGTTIAYQVTGDEALDIVVLPGVALPVDLMWEDPGFTRFRHRLEAFSRVILFEPRGRGASEGVPVVGISGGTFDEDLAAVLDAAGSERAVVPRPAILGPTASTSP